MVAVFILHKWGFALRTVADFLILDGSSNLFEVKGTSVAAAIMVLSFAELAETCAAILAKELIARIELSSNSTLWAEEVEFIDDFVSKLVKVVELHPFFQLDLTEGLSTVFDHTVKVFELPTTFFNFAVEESFDTRFAEAVITFSQINQIFEALKATWADLHIS